MIDWLSPAGAALGAASHTRGKYAGRKPGTHVDTSLQHVAGTGQGVGIGSDATAGAEPAAATGLRCRGRLVVTTSIATIPVTAGIAAIPVTSSIAAIPVTTGIATIIAASVTAIIIAPVTTIIAVTAVSITPVIIATISTAATRLSIIAPGGGDVIAPATSVATTRLCGPVPGAAKGARAGVAAVLGLPGVPLAGGVRLPGAIRGTWGAHRGPDRALKGAKATGGVKGAVARDTRADTRHLQKPWFKFNLILLFCFEHRHFPGNKTNINRRKYTQSS